MASIYKRKRMKSIPEGAKIVKGTMDNFPMIGATFHLFAVKFDQFKSVFYRIIDGNPDQRDRTEVGANAYMYYSGVIVRFIDEEASTGRGGL